MATPAITHGFPGQWLTTFGWMTLKRRGAKFAGVYQYGTTEGQITGTLVGNNLHIHYREPNEEGDGVFHLLRAGKFTGTYSAAGDPRVRHWEGERGWDGIWETDFGRVRLLQTADRVYGFYKGAGSSRIHGRTAGGHQLEFR